MKTISIAVSLLMAFNCFSAISITGLTATPNKLTTHNGQLADVALTYTVADTSGGAINCGVVITSNEGTSADWQIIDCNNVKLRDSLGRFSKGRKYFITVNVTNSLNETASAQTVVTVPR